MELQPYIISFIILFSLIDVLWLKLLTIWMRDKKTFLNWEFHYKYFRLYRVIHPFKVALGSMVASGAIVAGTPMGTILSQIISTLPGILTALIVLVLCIPYTFQKNREFFRESQKI